MCCVDLSKIDVSLKSSALCIRVPKGPASVIKEPSNETPIYIYRMS